MRKSMKIILWSGVGLAILLLVASTQVTLFVIQPIGAVPEGRTVVILRAEGTRFVDSADAFCLRVQDGVSLLCRGMVLAQVLENNVVIARLPYSEQLYLWSTGGARFDR